MASFLGIGSRADVRNALARTSRYTSYLNDNKSDTSQLIQQSNGAQDPSQRRTSRLPRPGTQMAPAIRKVPSIGTQSGMTICGPTMGASTAQKPGGNKKGQQRQVEGHFPPHLGIHRLAPHMRYNSNDPFHAHGVIIARPAYIKVAPWIIPSDWLAADLREIRAAISRNGCLTEVGYAPGVSNILWKSVTFESPRHGDKNRHDAHMKQVLGAYNDYRTFKNSQHAHEPWHTVAHDLMDRRESPMESFLKRDCVMVILRDREGGKHRVIWPEYLIKHVAWLKHGREYPEGFPLRLKGGGRGRGALAVWVRSPEQERTRTAKRPMTSQSKSDLFT